MVQDVDCRALDFEPDSFRDPDSLGETQVEVEVTRTAEAVYREIAECAGRWSRHQTWLKCRSGSLAGDRIDDYVKDIRVNKEHSARCLE